MGALSAGGLETVTDDLRPADRHNQRGYFEHQGAKNLAQDNSWLFSHRGRAIKLIYHQLFHLPESLPARILFMRRDLREVVKSQSAMLDRPDHSEDWTRILLRELLRLDRWMEQQSHLEYLYVSHRRVMQEKEVVMQEVAGFLKRDLNLKAMIASVDPALWRNKSG